MTGNVSKSKEGATTVHEEQVEHVADFLGFNPYDTSDFPRIETVNKCLPPGQPQGLASTARPTRLPKPPKGRLFVGVILFGVLAFAGFLLWNSFLRFQAYGTVEGHTIDVHPPWDGSVQFLHVKEGSRVRQGQLLATVHSIEFEHQLEKLSDELRVALATLEAERSRLTWQAGWNNNRHQDGVSEYYEAWGEFLKEQATLSQLELAFNRAEKLSVAGVNVADDLDEAKFEYHGQKEHVEKLKSRLGELKKRVDLSTGMVADGTPQLKPLLAKIDMLQGESERVRERLEQGQVKAPADGIVVHRPRLVGERCVANEPLLTILQDGSLEVVLYLPQQTALQFARGDDVNVIIDPYPSPIGCTVTRCGNTLISAPQHLERYYRSGEHLLPVFLRPDKEQMRWTALRIGGLVKLPTKVVARSDSNANPELEVSP